ncbi:glycosyltransferase family 2 protein [Candidatus Microgenomates bacterium]|nr:MAG: glycosyltransferase family 2 protein [Candidatus Microgenomates bacterium]
MEINNKLTAIIITKNEEKMIEDALKSLKFADEILVVDTGSFDKTIYIAKKYKAKIVKYTSGESFSDWRNKGLAEAKGNWVLYVDADERIPNALAGEISNILKTKSEGAFAIPRKNIVLGRELLHGGWYPDYVKRLFSVNVLTQWTGDLHEEPVFSGKLLHLENSMLHIKHETFSEMLIKTNKWSQIEAKLMFDANHPPMNTVRFVSAMWREFWSRMVLRNAYLDGKVGVIFSIYQVFSRFVSYAKLWEMQNESSNI